MHDKGINVYVMPENIPELLLDTYSNSKQNLKWSDSDSGRCQSFTPDPLTPQIQVNDENDRNGFNEDYEYDAGQRERAVGMKRVRDESPSLLSIETANSVKDGPTLKVLTSNLYNNQTRPMLVLALIFNFDFV